MPPKPKLSEEQKKKRIRMALDTIVEISIRILSEKNKKNNLSS